ncbi:MULTISPECIES: flagellar export protein FliJ [Vibrio]|uniref:Flagellar export protein FliJ n=1 Tax=Vibrio bivalvicida TaxID=1276888 RepID=A0ABV4MEE9_9VIBR|nr:flagellar export protein FliJ [Vibrio sp. VPAP30]KLN66225.1 flagellar export protein FliJ [Vibrio sp. VPAP30]
MQSKIQAIERFQKIEQKKRDLMSQQLELVRQQQTQAENQLEQLIELRKLSAPKSCSGTFFHREMLVNHSRVDQMINKLIVHQEQEQALKQAQCVSLQKHLQHKHIQVKGLDYTVERWQAELRTHQQHLEDIALEEVINNRFARKSR